MIPNKFFFVAVLAIANIWVFVAFIISWPGRPEVFSQYALGQTTPLVLYIGSSPPRRAEFYIDFSIPAGAHIAPLHSSNVATVVDSTLHNSYENALTYRTGRIETTFSNQNAFILSERELVKEFGVVEFCKGYIFPEPVSTICTSNDVIIEMNCGATPLATCMAHVNVEMGAAVYNAIPMQLSVSTPNHVFPLVFSNNVSKSFTVFSAQPGPMKTNITAHATDVLFSGSSIILSLPALQSSFVHSHTTGNITVYNLLSEEENTETLFYSVFVIFVFAYWVHVSKDITMAMYSSNTDLPADIVETITTGVPSVLIANISGSLAIASILSSLPYFSHAHIFLPVESTILIGKYGVYDASFSQWLYPIYQILASVVVLTGCLFLFVCRNKTDNQINSFLGRIAQKLHSTVTGQNGSSSVKTVPLFVIPAMRYCFELQLLNAAFTTVPPPAGAAFRITMGGFIAIGLQCIFGRDANFIFRFGGENRHFNLQLTLCTIVFVVASISLFYGTVLMMAPLLWITNVTPLDMSLGIGASFLVALTAAAFIISKPAPQQKPVGATSKYM